MTRLDETGRFRAEKLSSLSGLKSLSSVKAD